MQDYCDLSYPFKVKASAKFLEELYQCESGRYEDACNARENDTEREIIDNGYNLVYCDFGDRFKTQLEICNEQELEETLYALSTGTIDLFMPKAAERLYDDLQRVIVGLAPRAVNKPKIKPTKAQKQARVEFTSVVEKCVKRCIAYIVKENMVHHPETFKRTFSTKVKNTRSCWGGLNPQSQPTITIKTGYMGRTGNFNEYDRIQDSDFIGSFYSEKTSDHIMAIVCHEIAHAVDHWNGIHSSHGKNWQNIYRKLRIRFKLVGMSRPKHKKIDKT